MVGDVDMAWAWFEFGSRQDDACLDFGGVQREFESPQNPKPASKSSFQFFMFGMVSNFEMPI